MEYMYLKLCNLKEAEEQTDRQTKITGLRLPAASFSLKTRSYNSFTSKNSKKSIVYN